MSPAWLPLLTSSGVRARFCQRERALSQQEKPCVAWGGSDGDHGITGTVARHGGDRRGNAGALDLYRADAAGLLDHLDVRQEQHLSCHQRPEILERACAHRPAEAAWLA